MNQTLSRSRLTAPADPHEKLARLLGPAFRRYREDFARAEAGRRPPAPLHLDVDVTTACNFRCPMCPAGRGGHIFPGFQPGLRLERQLYRRALEEGASFGLPSVRLGMTGEPLLIADIDRWAAEAREAGVLDVSLITNGLLLTPERSRSLIQSGLTRLMVSVDGAEAETYAKIRPGGDWARLLANLEAFRRLRRELNSPTPLVRVSFVETPLNEGQQEAFLERFRPLADYFTFQRYQNLTGPAGADPAPEQKAPGRLCPDPWTRLALHADGGLFPCCSDFGRRAPLGNLKTDGLLSVWRSDRARALTRPEAGRESPCRECRAAAGET